MLISFLVIAAIVFLIVYLRTPQGRGFRGESAVKAVIGRNIEGARYVINDLRIRTDDGKTSQIDHVVIQANGIFVVETKNYSGRIYGNASQLEWTQVLQYGKIKNRFYNPLKQNKTHVYRIGQVLERRFPIYSAVVFVQGNTQYVDADGVYDLRSFKRLIALPRSGPLSYEDMTYIYSKLSEENARSCLSTSEHIANIQAMQSAIADNICPRCGNKLVLRKYNGSEFYGCSSYPKCRFTKNI